MSDTIREVGEPVTKSERNQTLKREDTISNSEVHLSKIGPAQVRKKYKGQSRFRTGDLPLAERDPADRASEGEAHSHPSCVRMVTVPSLGGKGEAKNIYFF